MKRLIDYLSNSKSPLLNSLDRLNPSDRSFIIGELKVIFDNDELMSVTTLSKFVFKIETFSGRYKLDLSELTIKRIK